MKITFDVDGVLNDITGYIIQKHNIKKVLTEYSISDNENLTSEEKKAIKDGYACLDNFIGAGFLPSVLRLKELDKESLYIHTLSSTEDIAKYKREKLKEYLDITDDHILCEQYTHGVGKKAVTDILVEDSIQNIVTYDIKVKGILIDKSYNKAETYGHTDEELNIKRVKNLDEAIDYIKELVSYES